MSTNGFTMSSEDNKLPVLWFGKPFWRHPPLKADRNTTLLSAGHLAPCYHIVSRRAGSGTILKAKIICRHSKLNRLARDQFVEIGRLEIPVWNDCTKHVTGWWVTCSLHPLVIWKSKRTQAQKDRNHESLAGIRQVRDWYHGKGLQWYLPYSGLMVTEQE